MKFKDKVLRLTKQIPEGKVSTYKEIAKALRTSAFRAVGNALHNNEQPIIIPCHRVVKTDGSIGGYALGVNEKIKILSKEGISVSQGKVDNFSKKLHAF